MIPKSVDICTSANDAITLEEQHAVKAGNIVFIQLGMVVTEELPTYTVLANIPYSCHPSVMEVYVKDIEFYIIDKTLRVRNTLPVGGYWISFVYPTL